MPLQSRIKLTAPFGVAKQKEQITGTDRIDELIERIKGSLQQAAKLHLEAVAAIKEIHDHKLYLKYAPTFIEFCEEKLNISKSVVYRKLHQLAVSEATGENSQNVPVREQCPLIENDLQQFNQQSETLMVTNPSIFPGSQLPPPEPKKAFKNKRMKPDLSFQAPASHFHKTTTVDPLKPQVPKDPYEAFTPQVILDEITQWYAETVARIQTHRDNPGFRKALTEWLKESGL